MKRIFSTTLFIGALLVGLVLAGAAIMPWSTDGSDTQEQVSTDIFRIQSGPDELHGLFSGVVKLDWTVVGAYADTLATPTPQPPEMPLPADFSAIDIGLQLTQTGNTISGFVDLDSTLVYTKEATIMATPLVPTPLPGEPPLEAVELAIGPALSGTFDGENIHLESDRIPAVLAGQPIQRQFQLISTAVWDDSVVTLTGEFRETVWGLSPQPLTVIGHFDLIQVLFNEDTIVISTPTPTPDNALTDTLWMPIIQRN